MLVMSEWSLEQKSLTSFNKQSIYVRNMCVKKRKKLWGNNFCQDTLPYQTFFFAAMTAAHMAEINICFVREKMNFFPPHIMIFSWKSFL